MARCGGRQSINIRLVAARTGMEEKEILEAFEKLNRTKGAQKLLQQHREYAQVTFRKDARINIRLSSRDLRRLQKRALEEGNSYQTLVASILHKYVEGRLRENG